MSDDYLDIGNDGLPKTSNGQRKIINNITANDIHHFDLVPTVDNYQRIATKNANYPGKGTALGLVYCSLKLNGEAGELAEHVGKSMRDNALMEVQKLSMERHELIIKEIGDALWYLSAICNELGITLELAAGTNLRKLHSRGVRDMLQGEGDNR